MGTIFIFKTMLNKHTHILQRTLVRERLDHCILLTFTFLVGMGKNNNFIKIVMNVLT